MAEKTYALMKLREIINGLNQIDADYHTGSYSAMDMSGAIMLTSENIADNCIRAAEIQQNFSSMSAKLVQELTIRQRMTDSRYAEWYDSAVHTVKVGFLLMMADADTDKTCDQECISMLVDFCQGDSLTDVTAHYFAATLLGALEPRKCYDLIMEDFRKYPNLSITAADTLMIPNSHGIRSALSAPYAAQISQNLITAQIRQNSKIQALLLLNCG